MADTTAPTARASTRDRTLGICARAGFLAKLFAPIVLSRTRAMQIPSSMPRLKAYGFPREIVAHPVCHNHRFAPSMADVDDILSERGVIVCRAAVRLWVDRFGAHLVACIRRDRPRPNDKGNLDEVVIPSHLPLFLGILRLNRSV